MDKNELIRLLTPAHQQQRPAPLSTMALSASPNEPISPYKAGLLKRLAAEPGVQYDRYIGAPLQAVNNVGNALLGRGTATQEDVLNTLLLVSGPGLLKGMLGKPAMGNTLGTFVGEQGAVALGKGSFVKKAKEMMKANKTISEILEKTGMLFGPDRKIRFWIPDTNSYFDPNMVRSSKKNPLSYSFSHPVLERATGGILDDITMRRSPKYASGEGRFLPFENLIELSKNPKMKDLLHELQHALQEKYGLAPGGSEEWLKRRGYKNAGDVYTKLFGELEAKVVEKRYGMTESQLAKESPLETLKKVMVEKKLIDDSVSIDDLYEHVVTIGSE